ncbi:methylated-DNA--[protein]-cysteine S-methyltransferase [Terriglobus roseus]|uniref:Methylated-DNA--protein-cysteine methyltransferase n=1 Tax=Terriglobus roseus TaxID=392734 RepID=A0A1G7K5N8_9BACT|nr:methylated-DNA--[protein]-cysteine S-methyltransferase [Terriglobus roseus]SDF32658.1 methylated-DNA-[protein]-cysteine S-methyltransferase [Terriglobus roseus]
MGLVKTSMPSPVGVLKLVASDAGLVAVLWPEDNPKRVRLEEAREDASHPVLKKAVVQLEEYFAGQRTEFDLPLDARGTEFQKLVWEQLLAIPYGKTRSYGEIAMRLGRPTASRAVGAANGRNPLSIVVPCHRVIGTSGALTGFAGGLETKRVLLELEGASMPRQKPLFSINTSKI